MPLKPTKITISPIPINVSTKEIVSYLNMRYPNWEHCSKADNFLFNQLKNKFLFIRHLNESVETVEIGKILQLRVLKNGAFSIYGDFIKVRRNIESGDLKSVAFHRYAEELVKIEEIEIVDIDDEFFENLKNKYKEISYCQIGDTNYYQVINMDDLSIKDIVHRFDFEIEF